MIYQSAQLEKKEFVIEITPQEIDEFCHIAESLTPGARISIAYHSRSSIAQHVDAAQRLYMMGFEPWPHIAARHLHSNEELDEFLGELVLKANIASCMFIAGHIPHSEGPFNDSLDLINSGLLQKHGIKEVGIAGHPSGHLNLPLSCVNALLHQKIQAITQAGMKPSIITQYELQADVTLSWIESLRQQGIDAPVYIGMLGPASAKVLSNIVSHCDFYPPKETQENYGLFSPPDTFITPQKLMHDYFKALNFATHGQCFFHVTYGKLSDIVTWTNKWANAKQLN